MEERDIIDLRKIKEIVASNWKALLSIVIGVTLFAMVVAVFLPKQFESTVLVRTKSQKPGSGISMQAAAAASLLVGGGLSNPMQSYLELIQSRSVLNPVIDELDLPPDKKEKLDNKSFAKSYLKVQNMKGTDLIEVKVTGKSPEEAQNIANGIVTSFQKVLTSLNQSEQSLLVKFLNDRIIIAKKDMEEAEVNLEKFRQQEKIFVPESQAKALVEKLTEYDKQIAKFQVQNESNAAKLSGVRSQIQQQNAALLQYNVSDNLETQQLRSAIIQKQLALVEMQQRYTDKHPNVIVVQKELNELNEKLKDTVAQAVASGTASMNPVHAGLLKERATTETELLVGQAAVDAMRKVQADNEKEISKLSAGSVTYIGLERQVKIAQEVYAVLVKNYEQARVQEAMESMDIQIVDAADLPKNPSGPKKVLITVVGAVLGIMLSLVYLIVLYRKKSNLPDNLNRSI